MIFLNINSENSGSSINKNEEGNYQVNIMTPKPNNIKLNNLFDWLDIVFSGNNHFYFIDADQWMRNYLVAYKKINRIRLNNWYNPNYEIVENQEIANNYKSEGEEIITTYHILANKCRYYAYKTEYEALYCQFYIIALALFDEVFKKYDFTDFIIHTAMHGPSGRNFPINIVETHIDFLSKRLREFLKDIIDQIETNPNVLGKNAQIQLKNLFEMKRALVDNKFQLLDFQPIGLLFENHVEQCLAYFDYFIESKAIQGEDSNLSSGKKNKIKKDMDKNQVASLMQLMLPNDDRNKQSSNFFKFLDYLSRKGIIEGKYPKINYLDESRYGKNQCLALIYVRAVQKKWMSKGIPAKKLVQAFNTTFRICVSSEKAFQRKNLKSIESREELKYEFEDMPSNNY